MNDDDDTQDYVRLCPQCEYNKNQAARWRAKAYKQAGHEIELPWVGLTEVEIWNAIRPLTNSDEFCTALVEVSMDEYRAIEAAHGIKENT